MKPTKDFIIKDMRKGVVEITIKNKDVEESIKGTLVNRIMGEKNIPTSDPNSYFTAQVNVLNLFDVEAKAWRSLDISLIKEYKGLISLL